jgi:hypothetical protein
LTTKTPFQPSPQPSSWQYSIPDSNGRALATYNGDVQITGDLIFDGPLDITDLIVSGNLTVDGDSFFNNAVTINTGNTSVTINSGGVTIAETGNSSITFTTQEGNIDIATTNGGNVSITTVGGDTTINDVTVSPGGNISTPGNISSGGNITANNILNTQVVLSPALTVIATTASTQGAYIAIADALVAGATLDNESVVVQHQNGVGDVEFSLEINTAAANEVVILTVVSGGEGAAQGAGASPVINIVSSLNFQLREEESAFIQSTDNVQSSIQEYWAPAPEKLVNETITIQGTYNPEQSNGSINAVAYAFSGVANINKPFDPTTTPVVNVGFGATQDNPFSIATGSDAVVIFMSNGIENIVTATSGATSLISNSGAQDETASSLTSVSSGIAETGASQSGFVIIGQFVMQWGQIPSTADGSSTDITFPLPFPNSCDAFLPATEGTAVVGDNASFQEVVGTRTTNGVTVYLQEFAGGAGPNQSGSWMALGH